MAVSHCRTAGRRRSAPRCRSCPGVTLTPHRAVAVYTSKYAYNFNYYIYIYTYIYIHNIYIYIYAYIYTYIHHGVERVLAAVGARWLTHVVRPPVDEGQHSVLALVQHGHRVGLELGLCAVQGLGFVVFVFVCLLFGVWGLGSRVWGLGFRVQGLSLRV